MRFLADGPSIPDELLAARDEGRVVFFCGAGVSLARAGLADFIGLAKSVANKLAVAPDSPTRQLINAIEKAPSIPGIGSLISADRVFSLIEREFLSRDIYEAIALALAPKPSVDLSAHRTILDLARGPDGQVRLVTTNFDLLFEACESSLLQWRPPRLPSPSRTDDFRGVVHLHGHVTDDYKNAAGDGFVISSAEFGQAYLSERWATDFIRQVLERFLVVFVGYAADDPPMQYLLEALNRSSTSMTGVYAFQSGTMEDAEARWIQKGVQPIAYGNSHERLWETLSAWAARAREPELWHDKIISAATGGPEAFARHERGQIAHVVSTLEGAKRFAAASDPPPASWLYVFDRAMRFAKPGRYGTLTEQGDYFDPFDAYGIDSDPVPPKVSQDDYFAKRELPPGTWDCFDLTRQDRLSLPDDQNANLRGYWSAHVPRLASRLNHIGRWLVRIASQPAAVSWAAGQVALHPEIRQEIRHAVEQSPSDFSTIVRHAWRLIFESWETDRGDFYPDWFRFAGRIKTEGWSPSAVREFGSVHRPYLKVQGALYGVARAAFQNPEPRLGELAHFDVEYPSENETLNVPIEFLPSLFD